MSDVKQPLTQMSRASRFAGRMVLRFVRVGAAWIVVMGCLALVAMRVSVARAGDAGMKFGDELVRVGEHHVSGDLSDGVMLVDLNGQRVATANTTTGRSLDEVLSYFHEQCRHHAGGLRDTFGRLDSALATLDPSTGTDGALVLRQDQGDRGFVFCVAPDHVLSNEEKLARMGTMGKTFDIHAMGDVRYVTARSGADGTFVMAMWNDGSFNLAKMLPGEGDAPGEDMAGVPRPDGARRLLTGYVQGSPFGVNGYEVPGPTDIVLSGIDAKLSAAGWRPISGPMTEDGRIYSLGNTLDLVVSVSDTGNGKTEATYVVSQNIGHLTL